MKKSLLNNFPIFSIFATMCLGLLLLIPVVNIYLLRLVIHQETGIKTNYWERPLGKDMYGKWRNKGD